MVGDGQLASKVEDALASQTDTSPFWLIQRLEARRSELIEQFHQVLRETLFTNRSVLRPSMLKRIAEEEVEALLHFLRSFPSNLDLERGAQLCQVGLSEGTVLRLGQATRRTLLTGLENDRVIPMLEALEAYQDAQIQGYIKYREKIILAEQEDIRKAFELTISRYSVEMKEIQALAQQATEANEFKSRFISRISHELRTPLGGLLGMADMLQCNVYGPLSPAQQDIVQRIIKNVRILEQVFLDFLDQSQIETGQLYLREEQFSPQVLAQTVHSNYLPKALQKGLTLQLHIDSGLPHVLIGDSKRIGQILTNLVANAVKFTETGGIVIDIKRNSGAQQWILQVKDTGIGIAKEAQAYIFEPFRQADESLERSKEGVGLGLAIVQQLVIAMKGTVSVDSKIGQGSTFTVTLPLRVTKDELS